MEIGGWDYVFFSDRKVEEVLPKFKETIKLRWEDPFIQDYSCCTNNGKEVIDLSFSKDEAMSKMWEETEKFTDEMGEGTFSFMSSQYRNFSANILVTEIDYVGKEYNREEGYPVFTGFALLYQYTLVLPESIEENEFSGFVYDTLAKVLSGA